MGRQVVLDTNIIIDLLGGIPGAQEVMTAYPNSYISVVSWIEVMAGTKMEQEADVRKFLRRFMVIQLNSPVAVRAFQLRRETRLKVPDATILAAAQVQGCTLITRNTRDFFGKGLDVYFPYKL